MGLIKSLTARSTRVCNSFLDCSWLKCADPRQTYYNQLHLDRYNKISQRSQSSFITEKLFLSIGRCREVPLSNIEHGIHDSLIYLGSCCNQNITTRITRWRIHILCGFKRILIYWFYKITCANCSFAAHDHTGSYSRRCPSNCQFQLQLKEAHGYSHSKP